MLGKQRGDGDNFRSVNLNVTYLNKRKQRITRDLTCLQNRLTLNTISSNRQSESERGEKTRCMRIVVAFCAVFFEPQFSIEHGERVEFKASMSTHVLLYFLF